MSKDKRRSRDRLLALLRRLQDREEDPYCEKRPVLFAHCEGGIGLTKEIQKWSDKGYIAIGRQKKWSFFGDHIRISFVTMTEKGRALLKTSRR